MRILTSKDFHLALKNHWTFERFCECYKLTDKTFITAVSKVYSNNPTTAEKVTKELKENSENAAKAARKRAKKMQKYYISTSKCDEAIDITDELLEEEAVNALIHESTPVEEDFSSDKENYTTLEALKKHYEEICASIYSYEVVRKNLLSDRKNILSEMRTIRDNAVSLKDTLISMQEDFEKVVSEISFNDQKLSLANIDLNFLKEEQQNTQEKIKEFEKVTVFICTDGTILAENFSGELPEADKALVDRYSLDDTFEDTPRKQLRVICQLLAFTIILNNEGKLYECMFENSTLETVWKKILVEN